MKALVMLLSCLVMVSCNDVKGTLEVVQDLRLKSKKSEFTVAPGSYRTNIDFKSKKKFEIEIKSADEKKVALVLLKKEVKIPSNGSFQILASNNNQGLDIDGEVQTVIERSQIYRDQESCSYTVYRRRCQVDRRGRRSCYDEPITRHGYRWVDYHYEDKTSDYAMDLSKDGQLYAEFSAHETSRRRVEDYVGSCR